MVSDLHNGGATESGPSRQNAGSRHHLSVNFTLALTTDTLHYSGGTSAADPNGCTRSAAFELIPRIIVQNIEVEGRLG
jgi:hypothetical protein